MLCLGTLINVGTILAGSTAGMLLKKIFPERITDTLLQGVGLSSMIIGLSGTLAGAFTIIDGGISTRYIMLMILSLAIGGLLGELIRIEDGLAAFAGFVEARASGGKERSQEHPDTASDTASFARGFITATLVFCVGSMAIVGAIEEGINNNSDILIAKSILDGITSMILASTMGIGVLFSAITVGLYQGSITLLASVIAPYLGEAVIAQMSLVGSVLIMAIGLNILKIAKIKVGNFLPAIFIPLIYYAIQLWAQ